MLLLLWCQSVFRSYWYVAKRFSCRAAILASCFPDMLLRWQSVILSCCYAAMFWAPNVVIVFVPCCNAILSCSLVKLSNSQSVMPPYCLAAQCPAAIQLYSHVAMLPSCYTVIQPRCHVAQPPYCFAAMLPCCPAAILLYNHVAMLPSCYTDIQLRCHVAQLLYSYTAMLPCCPATIQLQPCCHAAHSCHSVMQ